MGFPQTKTHPYIYTQKNTAKAQDEEHTGCLCDGKITTLLFEYLGNEEAYVTIDDHKDVLIYNDTIQPNDEFQIWHPSKNTLGPNIEWTVTTNDESCEGEFSVHTSCSADIYVGLVVGGGCFEVLYGESRNNGPLCTHPHPHTNIAADDPPR